MVKGIFSIYDEKAQVHGPLFTFGHKGEAFRQFSDMIKDPKYGLSAHASDYTLYKVGEFNDVTGDIFANMPTLDKAGKVIAGSGGHERLASGSDFLDPK